MIPFMAVVRVRTERRHHFRIWLPLFLIWLLLLPLILLLVPVIFVVCLVYPLNPFCVLLTGWQLVAGLTGTHVEIGHGKSQVLVRIF